MIFCLHNSYKCLLSVIAVGKNMAQAEKAKIRMASPCLRCSEVTTGCRHYTCYH